MLPLCVMELKDENDRALMIWMYETYERFMFGVGLNFLKHPEDAEDAVQKCWMSWCKPLDLEKIRALCAKPACEMKNFIASCMINRCKDVLREKHRRAEVSLDGQSGFFDALRPMENIPEKQALLREEVQECMDALQTLSPTYRDIAMLFFFQQMSCKEIAAMFEKNENYVRAVLANVRKKLGRFTPDPREGDAR